MMRGKRVLEQSGWNLAETFNLLPELPLYHYQEYKKCKNQTEY